jgi:hypothetical protein
VAEKEETSRPACTLAGFEDHVSVELRTQAFIKVLEAVDPPVLIKVLKIMDHMESHFHFLFEDSNILILINFKSLIRIFS